MMISYRVLSPTSTIIHGFQRPGFFDCDSRTVPRPLAFKLIYDAYTEPLLHRSYSDDAPVPAGINRFDLHPYYCENGKHLDYRSDRKGPFRPA